MPSRCTGSFAARNSVSRSLAPTVTLAVPTYRRPYALSMLLPMLLDQLERVQAEFAVEAEILVIDNDVSRSAAPVAARDDRSIVRYISEPQPGVAAVRNRALTEARGRDVLVFLDDDQIPARRWLVSLLNMWREHPGSAAAGPVQSILPPGIDPWIQEGAFFARRYRERQRNGDLLQEVATTNLLLDLRTVERLGLRFDERFGLSGGEDSLFTRSLTRSGGAIRWCQDAVVLEKLPTDRLTRRWVCDRAVSSGNTAARVALALANSPIDSWAVRLHLLIGGMARAGSGCGQYLTGLMTRSIRHQGTGIRTALRGLGMALGAADFTYLEYRRGGRRWVRESVVRRVTP